MRWLGWSAYSLLKQTRPCAGELDTRAMVYITLNDYANLGKTAGMRVRAQSVLGRDAHRSFGLLPPRCRYSARRYCSHDMHATRLSFSQTQSPHSTLPLTR